MTQHSHEAEHNKTARLENLVMELRAEVRRLHHLIADAKRTAGELEVILQSGWEKKS